MLVDDSQDADLSAPDPEVDRIWKARDQSAARVSDGDWKPQWPLGYAVKGRLNGVEKAGSEIVLLSFVPIARIC